MKIVALNLDIEWKNPQRNFEIIKQKLANETADVFLLPEMFSTGFYMKPSEIADENGQTLLWMKNLAQMKNAAIAGSVSVKENDQFYNRFFFVEPSGKVNSYDKRHLFSFSGEDKIYSPGRERTIVSFRGIRFLLQICYDLRFPVFARNNDDYDAILYIANWPEVRIDAWKTLLKARAIENQAFVVGCNRIGKDGNHLSYPESSFCFFADGKEISQPQKDLISASLDLSELNKFREKYAFLNDRDRFELDLG